MKNRPAIAATLTKIIRNAALAGGTLSTITNRVAPQSASPTPPVWVRPVRQPAAPADDRRQVGPSHSAQQAARRQQGRDERADPTALRGGHEFLHQREIDGIEAGIADADEESHDAEKDPAGDPPIRTGGEVHD